MAIRIPRPGINWIHYLEHQRPYTKSEKPTTVVVGPTPDYMVTLTPAAATTRKLERLDPSVLSDITTAVRDKLAASIIGQTPAVDAVMEVIQSCRARQLVVATKTTELPGSVAHEGPIGALLFLGPTGTGKTYLVEALAEALHGSARKMLKVNCGEYQHAHEVAKLIGAPPGYLGHRETTPIFTTLQLREITSDVWPVSIIMFDEIEKAHAALTRYLLGVLDKGEALSGDNSKVDFSNCIIIFTSNLGTRELLDLGRFHLEGTPSTGQERRESLGVSTADKFFAPEFRNRLTKTVVFHPFTHDELLRLARKEMGKMLGGLVDMEAGVDEAVVEAVVQAGTSDKYGARLLKRTIEAMLVRPITNLIDSGALTNRAKLVILPGEGKFDFYVAE